MTSPAAEGMAPSAVTMGDPAGIGGELTLAAWQRPDAPAFVALDDPDRLSAIACTLGVELRLRVLDRPEDIPRTDPADMSRWFAERLPVLPCPLPVSATPGRLDPEHGTAVLSSIRQAVELAMSGAVSAVVTNPIHKANLYAAGFEHPGHTEYLAALAGTHAPPVMMLAGPSLRVVPATIHCRLGDVPRMLTQSMVEHVARVTLAALSTDFGIANPRIAISGLNPHAGESGALGSEEALVIEPAVAALRQEGIMVNGPVAADTLFHAEARQGYDAAICMYHDQALIPIKTLDFDEAVNVTLGLPFVRTSPDHGTALDIAGQGRANPTSFLCALRLAGQLAASRARACRP